MEHHGKTKLRAKEQGLVGGIRFQNFGVDSDSASIGNTCGVEVFFHNFLPGIGFGRDCWLDGMGLPLGGQELGRSTFDVSCYPLRDCRFIYFFTKKTTFSVAHCSDCSMISLR